MISINSLLTSLSNWKPCNFETYKIAYFNYGGSACTHPDVLSFIEKNSNVKMEYFCIFENDECIAAIYSLNKKIQLFNPKLPFCFDDIKIPIKKGLRTYIPFKSTRISPNHNSDFFNTFASNKLKHKIAHVKESFSKSTIKKRNGELNKFLRGGGEIRSIDTFSSDDLADIYIKLFKSRWSEKIYCFSREVLINTFSELKHLLFGSILFMNEKPCAFDIIFMAESKSSLYFDDINGGYSTELKEHNLGSILLWVNISNAKKIGSLKNKVVTFSLGIYLDWNYKRQWCNIIPLGRNFF